MTSPAPLPSGPPQRLVYFGTPAMAVPPLHALVRAGIDVALVVTRIDKRRGRGSELAPSPVKAAAHELLIPVSHRVDDALDVGADLGVVVAFGQIIKPHVLAELPMVNLHFSLLPRWRGAAPVERALLAGDEATGVCLMQLEEGLDTGPVLDRVVVPIGERQTAEELRNALVEVGTDMLVAACTSGLGTPTPQSGEPTYAAKLDPAEFVIDWSAPSDVVDRLVRLGVAWSTFRGKRVKVLAAVPIDASGSSGTFLSSTSVACGVGALEILRVQPEGKPPMAAADWARGAHPQPGEPIGAPATAVDAG